MTVTRGAAKEWPELTPAQYANAVGDGYTEDEAVRQLEGARLEAEYKKGMMLCYAPTRLKVSLALVAYSEGLELPPMTPRQLKMFNLHARPYGDWLKVNGAQRSSKKNMHK